MLDKKMKLMTLINLNKIRIQEDEWMLYFMSLQSNNVDVTKFTIKIT